MNSKKEKANYLCYTVWSLVTVRESVTSARGYDEGKLDAYFFFFFSFIVDRSVVDGARSS